MRGGGGGGGGSSFEIAWTDPRHESFLQDRSGPWEESTKKSYRRQTARGSSSQLLLLVSQSHFEPLAQIRVQKRKRIFRRKDLVQINARVTDCSEREKTKTKLIQHIAN